MVFEHFSNSIFNKMLKKWSQPRASREPARARPRKPLKTNGFPLVSQWYAQDISVHQATEKIGKNQNWI